MAHRVLEDYPITGNKAKKEIFFKKIFKADTPNLMGKFGLSFSVGKKEFFIGVAVANIEVERVIKRKKQKVITHEGIGRIVDL
jgi:hypothetical protein